MKRRFKNSGAGGTRSLSQRIARWMRNPMAICSMASFVLALLFILLSRVLVPGPDAASKSARKLEQRLHERVELLDAYAQKALETSTDEWIAIDDLPEDMVIYKYCSDTIQSWIHRFPINNDDADLMPLWYRLHYNTKNYFSTPLAFLTEKLQYVNLGSGWYVVRSYLNDDSKVVAGLLVKSEYSTDNPILESRINPNLGESRLNIIPINYGDGIPVLSNDGSFLFYVEPTLQTSSSQGSVLLLWMALLMGLLTFHFIHVWRRNLWSFVALVVGGLALGVAAIAIGRELRFDSNIFSPNLYADYFPFSSLGNLLILNLLVYFIANGLYVLRKGIFRIISAERWRWQCLTFALAPVALALYINWTLRSLIDNSNIALELFNITELSVYSILCFVSYALLFVAMFFLLQLLSMLSGKYSKVTFAHWKYTILFLLAVTLYFVATVSIKSYNKESDRAKVWLNKLSVERDISLELQLRSVEGKIPMDPVIRKILDSPLTADATSLLNKRLDELYLIGLAQKYEIVVTLCRDDDQLMYQDGRRLMNCNSYYQDQVMSYGLPLSDKYFFFFLNNYNGRVSYLGVFTYQRESEKVSLFIELNSRVTKESDEYSSLLFDYKTIDKVNMPVDYSYAKYIDGRLTVYSGDYNYKVYVDADQFPAGYSTFIKDGYRQFVNKFSDDVTIIISRMRRSVLQYVISFSYLLLFNAALLFGIHYMRKFNRRRVKKSIPRRSVKKRITNLVTASLAVSMLFMALGSIWFSWKYFDTANRSQMEEKLLTVQSTLSDFSRYVDAYTNVNSQDLTQDLARLAQSMQADINLFDPHGSLIHSTQPELFNRYILSSRMDNKAYRRIVLGNERVVIQKEKIASLSYYSMYAPLFNVNGSLVAIVNIPYFAKTISFRNDMSAIIATIINLYILLMLFAFINGRFLSNSLLEPIAMIGSRMRRTDVQGHSEHINYDGTDELGALVASYNQMVDYIEASTRRLAAAEREKAWNEMASQIAHEIKNPLTPIRLNIQYLLMLKKKGVDSWDEKFEASADSILEQIDNLSNIATEFSSFTKSYSETPEVLDLHTLISNQRTLFDTGDDLKVLFTSRLVQDEALVFARKGNIVKVLMNLLSNASQAIENGVKSQNAMGFIRIALDKDNGFYKVSVEDNGPGVLEENVERLFHPKFTTKTSGTGLGLAISRNIIEQAGGTISYSKSELGGACFTFTLPIYNAEEYGEQENNSSN